MSFREDALKERIEAVRPKLAKAREIAEKAESENRAITAEEQRPSTRSWPRAARSPTR